MTINAMSLVSASGLTKHYEGFSLQGVSLSVDPGQVLGFIGQNGAGKTTTIKALLGLIHLDGGEATVLGAPAGDLSRTAAGAVAKERIGVVLDSMSLPGHLRMGEVGRLMAAAYSTWDQALYQQLLEQLGLGQLGRKKTLKELSRGMGMKLSLACALAHHPRLLILDEATAGLDPMARDQVLEILRAFVSEEDAAGEPQNGILMSSHITSDLEKIADTLLCIDAGASVFCVEKDQVTDVMGVARCRASEVALLREELSSPEVPLRVLRHEAGTDVLVENRFDFAAAYPGIVCDRMDIDTYMALMLKGERLA